MDFNADYKAEKKKTSKKILSVVLILGLLFTGTTAYGVYWIFLDWSRFKDEMNRSTYLPTSLDGTYTVNAYLSNGAATVSYSVLEELVFNKENKRSKKIYWQYREENAKIEWIDDSTVMINNVQLNLLDETYDYRSGIK